MYMYTIIVIIKKKKERKKNGEHKDEAFLHLEGNHMFFYFSSLPHHLCSLLSTPTSMEEQKNN